MDESSAYFGILASKPHGPGTKTVSSKDKQPSDKLWGGRFTSAADTLAETFTTSVAIDQRLWRHDIRGSIAHAAMLARIGVLSDEERDSITAGLSAIADDIAEGRFRWSDALEDVHMNIEAALTERIGEAGKRLHTARSRNDQVATDMRLYLRDETDVVLERIGELQSVIVDTADGEADTIMPGFTHLQPAQPVTFGHHMMAWYQMLERDQERLVECRHRINRMPLGSCALAGTSFPIDRAMTAELLGFEGVCENSLDAVSDRDFAIEFCSNSTLLMIHLSRMAEELVLWSSAQFDFIELDDAFCTGSSIMPQKKNPDVAEIIRGKSARVAGCLNTLLMVMKAQPLSYNRDNQEDKEPLFDTVDTVQACLRVLAAMLPGMQIKREALREAARRGFSTATDLADYLVRKGVAFREAHEIVGRAVRHGIETGQDLSEMDIERLRTFNPVIEPDVFDVLTLEGSVEARSHVGGTAPARVREAVKEAKRRLATRG